MKIKFALLTLIAILTFNIVDAQTRVSDYKYVVVPKKFDFLKDDNQYRLNTLTKLLFEKYGFTAFMDDEVLPNDAATNNCLMLNSNVIKERGMFNTKLKIELRNCKNEVIYTSNIGESREKKFQVAYNLALRDAFNSFETVNYKYVPNSSIVSNEQNNEKEVEKLKEEIRVLKEEKKGITKSPKSEKPKKVAKVIVDSPKKEDNTDVLYAQKTNQGFQLVDSTPKIIYKIRKTGMANTYLVEGMSAIIYKLDANWILEYYKDGNLQTKLLNIKF